MKRAGCVVRFGGSEKNQLIIANDQSDDLCLPAWTQHPLINGFIDNALRDARPCVNKALLRHLRLRNLAAN